MNIDEAVNALIDLEGQQLNPSEELDEQYKILRTFAMSFLGGCLPEEREIEPKESDDDITTKSIRIGAKAFNACRSQVLSNARKQLGI